MTDLTPREKILATMLEQSWLRANPALVRAGDTAALLALTLADDLGLDSLDITAAVVDVEDAFGLDDVPDDEIDGLKTVGDVVGLVERKVKP